MLGAWQKKLLVSCVFMAGLGGCNAVSVGVPVGPSSIARSNDSRVAAIRNEIELRCLRQASSASATGTQGVSVPDFSSEYSMSQRNHLITAYMYAADEAYLSYERRLFQLIRRDNLSASTLSLMLSTLASTIQGHEELVRSLSAANTVVTGTQAAISRDYLLSQSLQVMLLQMRANRARQRALILGRLGNSISAWPLCVALSDALAFEQAGTLTEALVRASEAAANESRDNEQQVRSAIPTVDLARTPTAVALDQYLYPADEDLWADRAAIVQRAIADRALLSRPGLTPGERMRIIVTDPGPDRERERRMIIEYLLNASEVDAELKAALSQAIPG